jgi:hypothetical protein
MERSYKHGEAKGMGRKQEKAAAREEGARKTYQASKYRSKARGDAADPCAAAHEPVSILSIFITKHLRRQIGFSANTQEMKLIGSHTNLSRAKSNKTYKDKT